MGVSSKVISIDGSQGEGGGQIVRTGLALAAALHRNIHITNIRASRENPGLGHQHLAAVRAAAAVCDAKVTGDQIGSKELTFTPGKLKAGEYRFEIGTAGSTVLVLQTVIPALTLASGDSVVTVTGGTHNPLAPCFEYLRDVFLILASATNVQIYCEMIRPGFYPAGGGEVRMTIRGLRSRNNMRCVRMVTRGKLRRIDGVSTVSKQLPQDIVHRQGTQVISQLAKAGRKATIEHLRWDTDSPGTMVFLRAVFARSVAGFFALGERGKPAEQVADEATGPLLDFIYSSGIVDARAADQLLPITALAHEESRFVTDRVTDHLLTNAAVIGQLTDRTIRIDAEPGEPAEVTIEAD